MKLEGMNTLARMNPPGSPSILTGVLSDRTGEELEIPIHKERNTEPFSIKDAEAGQQVRKDLKSIRLDSVSDLVVDAEQLMTMEKGAARAHAQELIVHELAALTSKVMDDIEVDFKKVKMMLLATRTVVEHSQQLFDEYEHLADLH